MKKRNYQSTFFFNKLNTITSIEDKVASKDDEIQSEAWSQALKTAAYYFDHPTSADRFKMMNKLDLNFDSLLKQTKTPDETPDLRSNKHLVRWVCKKYNEYLEEKGSNNVMDCNVNKLMKAYGPNTEEVKRNLGGQDFFL